MRFNGLAVTLHLKTAQFWLKSVLTILQNLAVFSTIFPFHRTEGTAGRDADLLLSVWLIKSVLIFKEYLLQ